MSNYIACTAITIADGQVLATTRLIDHITEPHNIEARAHMAMEVDVSNHCSKDVTSCTYTCNYIE